MQRKCWKRSTWNRATLYNALKQNLKIQKEISSDGMDIYIIIMAFNPLSVFHQLKQPFCVVMHHVDQAVSFGIIISNKIRCWFNQIKDKTSDDDVRYGLTWSKYLILAAWNKPLLIVALLNEMLKLFTDKIVSLIISGWINRGGDQSNDYSKLLMGLMVNAKMKNSFS